MSAVSQHQPHPLSVGFLKTRWALLAVLGTAVVLRFLFAGRWSLWQDEESSIFFSLNLGAQFPRHFPLFFALLRGLFECTGVSVHAGRLLAASLGVISIGLVFQVISRLVSREVGVLAAVFLTLSLGHLFWSQSIRYYILLFVFQVISVYLFVDGFERGRPRELVLVSVFLLLGVLSHLSGALLFPVLVGHLALSMLLRERGGGYGLKGYMAFGIPFVVVCAIFCGQYFSFRASLSSLVTREQGSEPAALLVRLVAYFGAPAFVLSLLAPWVGRGIVPGRILRFFTCLAFIPMLELLVIAKLNIVIALWYQGFIAIVGVVTLSAITLYSLRQRGWLLAYRVALFGSVLVSLPFLFGYYTSMHGDRPRWEEAARFVREASAVDPGSGRSPLIYSTVAPIVAFYLGSDPSATIDQSIVKDLPPRPSEKPVESEEWFVVENDEIPQAYVKWFAQECVLAAKFEARTGPKDRTIFVYRHRPGTPR